MLGFIHLPHAVESEWPHSGVTISCFYLLLYSVNFRISAAVKRGREIWVTSCGCFYDITKSDL